MATGDVPEQDLFHDPTRRSLYENGLEFQGYLEWRDKTKFVASEGGAGWNDQLLLSPVAEYEASPTEEAYAIMRQLLTSGERFHIGKCVQCGKFFWRKKLSPAKRGLFCGVDCQRVRGANSSREKNRDSLLERRIERAVEAAHKVSGQTTTKEIRSVKDEMVKAVNAKKRRDEDNIKLSWVSRHWSIILEKAKSKRSSK